MTEFLVDRLPQNTEAEQALLGSVLISNECLDKIEGVDASDFYKESNQRIFECMKELHEKESPIDIITLSTKLKEKRMLSRIGGEGYLASLSNSVPTAGSVKHYAKLVTETSLRRKLIDKAEHITRSAYDEKQEISELLDFADNEITAVIEGNSERLGDEKPANLKDLAHQFDEFYDAGEEEGTEFGIEPIDNEFIKLPKGEVATIQAPTGGRKTMFAMNIAYKLAKSGKKVLYINLEMRPSDIVSRLVSISSGLDSYVIKRRGFTEGEVCSALAKLAEVNMKIASPATMTIQQIERMAKLEKKKNGLDYLVIDHLHLIKAKTPDPILRAASNAEGVKTIARKLDVPVLCLLQISRYAQMNGKKPEKTDARDSSVIENTMGIMFALSNQTMPTLHITPDENEVTLTVLKNRYGRDGYEIPLKFNWRNLRFYG